MPIYDVNTTEQTLIDNIPEVVKTKDPQRIFNKLKELYLDKKNLDYMSAMMIIEKYLFRTYELLYFVLGNEVEFDYEEYYFDEQIHNSVIHAAKGKLDAKLAQKKYDEAVELIRTHQNEEAGKLFRESAIGGNIGGAYNYGISLSRGEGCEVDALEGAYWYWVAACEGHARAMVNLATCFRYGDGVCADGMTMLYWYIQATLVGNLDAAYTFGHCLLNEIGLSGLQALGQKVILCAQNIQEREYTEDLIHIATKLTESLKPYIYNRKF